MNLTRASGSCQVNIENSISNYIYLIQFMYIQYYIYFILADAHDHESERTKRVREQRDARGGGNILFVN